MAVLPLVLATLVVGGGLAWGGVALRGRGVNGGGIAMLFAAVVVVLGGGLRAAVIASKRAATEATDAGGDVTSPSTDEETRARAVCAGNSGLHDAWSVTSYCGCVAVGWREARQLDPHFAVTAHRSGQLVLEGDDASLGRFRRAFAACARPSISAWIGHECSATCRQQLSGDDAQHRCDSVCTCVARDVGMRDPDAFARSIWQSGDGSGGEGPLDRTIVAAIQRCH